MSVTPESPGLLNYKKKAISKRMSVTPETPETPELQKRGDIKTNVCNS